MAQPGILQEQTIDDLETSIQQSKDKVFDFFNWKIFEVQRKSTQSASR